MRKHLGSDKRGIEDSIFIPIYIISFLVIISVVGTIVYELWNFADTDPNTDTTTKNAMLDLLNKYTAVIDYSLLLVFFSAVTGAVIGAYQIKSNILYFIGGFLFWMLTWVFLPFLANIGWKVIDNNIIFQFTQNLPKTRLFLDNYIVLCLMSGALILLAMYAKRGNFPSSGGSKDAFG